ncbi:MAG: 5-dehydro-2-deoxygluconokinase [Actinomycetaceae bacterium]|nr:5-dehydro-2-deoxygluconokinase [Actinomycetaceae bacterium]
MRAETSEVLSIGRCGIDIYPFQIGIGLEDVHSFGKFLGGSPTNVAVASARLGHSAAIITGVGNDPFGSFIRKECARLGVSTEYIVTNDRYHTPVTFCEIFPPDNFPLYFYRDPSAPDLELTQADLPIPAVGGAPNFWLSVTGLSEEPSRRAHHYALDSRGKRRWTIADLDYREMFWQSSRKATYEVGRILEKVDVAIGNKQECLVAVGETDPDRAADALLERGIEIAVVKQGPAGILAKTAEERIEVPVTPINVANGLGAGDSFGGAFCHGLLCGWDLQRTVAFASAAGALVASRLECSTAMGTETEIIDLMRANPQVKPSVEKRLL